MTYDALQELIDERDTLRATISRLTEEREEANAAIARVWKALGISTYEQAGGKEISEIVGGLRAALQEIADAIPPNQGGTQGAIRTRARAALATPAVPDADRGSTA